MKLMIKINTRYIPMTQQRWCCVPTCISMIMYRLGISLVAQEELGYHLGLIVPEDQVYLFNKVKTGPKPAGGYGTRIFKKEYYPNEAFKKLNIPLGMIYHPIDEFEDEKALEKEDKDAILCFDYGILHDHSHRGGHAVVFDRMIDGEARIVDPWIEMPKWQTYKTDKLYKAMQKHTSKQMAGVWVFEDN